MFCPNCGEKYEKNKAVCSARKVPLKKGVSNVEKQQRIKFITVYQTGDYGFLAFAKSILQSEGIPYYFKGEGLQDLDGAGRLGTGFNPLFGPVEIQVDENDAEKAREILEQIEQGKVDMPESEYIDQEVEENTRSTRPEEKKSLKGVLRGSIIGILISICAYYIYEAVQNYRQKNFSWIGYNDLNKDGKNDITYYYEKGILSWSEEDRNFDGKIDTKWFYKEEAVDRCVADENYDGAFEAKYFYQKGIVQRGEFDVNHDKNLDVIENYIDGVIYDSVYYHEITGKVWKKVFYRYGIINEEQIDKDYDGKFDITIKYNESGRPVKTIASKK